MFTGFLVLSLKCVTWPHFFLWTSEESEPCEMVALDNDNYQHTFTCVIIVCINWIWNWVPIKKSKKKVCVSDAECRIIFKTLSFYNQSSSQVVIKFCNLSQWLVSCRLVFLMYGNHMKNKTHTYVGSMMPFFTVETKRCITVG